MENPILYVETRGALDENIHRGSIYVIAEGEKEVYSCGDVLSPRFYRSASKPLQALPVLALPEEKLFGTSDEECVLFAASHLGDRCHIDTLHKMFQRYGFSEDALIMNPMAGRCGEISKLAHCCSGKHTGLMLLAQALSGDYRDYYRLESAAQQEVLRCISAMSGVAAEEIGIGIDGCGVPVFAVPLKNMALSFLRLVCPELCPDPGLIPAAMRLNRAVTRYPHMIRGENSLDMALNSDPNLIAKSGRFGVYCIGFRKERMALALKIDDGDDEHTSVLLSALLKRLGYDNPALYEELDKVLPGEILNDAGDCVGKVEPRLP